MDKTRVIQMKKNYRYEFTGKTVAGFGTVDYEYNVIDVTTGELVGTYYTSEPLHFIEKK